MEPKDEAYVKNLASIETPRWKRGQANSAYENVCYLYCRIRNLAKDILQRQQLDEESRNKLRRLLTRANKLES